MGEIVKKDYSNGKIYCIRNWLDDDVYVGSTTQALSKRMERHRGNVYGKKCWNYKLYQKMRELGKEHFYIELIEKYECSDIEELRKKEGEWIRKMGTINQLIAGRTRSEYLIEKKDELSEQQKGYRDEHKEHKQKYDKEYRENNKEKVSKTQQKKYENKKEHYKQKSSENYFKNKEAIREKMNAKCHCECGVVYSYGNRLRHFNSKTQNYLNNNINNVQVSQEEQENRSEDTSS